MPRPNHAIATTVAFAFLVLAMLTLSRFNSPRHFPPERETAAPAPAGPKHRDDAGGKNATADGNGQPDDHPHKPPCAPDYTSCGALRAPSSNFPCCNPNSYCYRRQPYFSQCRPRDAPVRPPSSTAAADAARLFFSGYGYLGHRPPFRAAPIAEAAAAACARPLAACQMRARAPCCAAHAFQCRLAAPFSVARCLPRAPLERPVLYLPRAGAPAAPAAPAEAAAAAEEELSPPPRQQQEPAWAWLAPPVHRLRR